MLVPTERILRKPELKSPIKLCIQGSTGSIGTSALDIVREHPDKIHVTALCGGSNVELLAAQAREFSPKVVACGDEAGAVKLRGLLGGGVEILSGEQGIVAASQRADVDVVLASIVGVAGLKPVMGALRAGKRVALANKEALVSGGRFVAEALKAGGGALIPVDSEHSAIFQALQGEFEADIETIVLTASGGPFLNTPVEKLTNVTPADAVRHPRWSMGAKISIDSATLMNKALEVIEAHWLYSAPESRIEVLVHPQSIVHSLVRFVDGAELAQLSIPDMKGAIGYALFYPTGRYPRIMGRLSLPEAGRLEFLPLDERRFPAVRLAREAIRAGGVASAVLNLGNELAVERFSTGKLNFTEIVPFAERLMNEFAARTAESFDDLVALLAEVRERSR